MCSIETPERSTHEIAVIATVGCADTPAIRPTQQTAVASSQPGTQQRTESRTDGSTVVAASDKANEAALGVTKSASQRPSVDAADVLAADIVAIEPSVAPANGPALEAAVAKAHLAAHAVAVQHAERTAHAVAALPAVEQS